MTPISNFGASAVVVEFNGRVGLEFIGSFSNKIKQYVHHLIGNSVISSALHFQSMVNIFDRVIRARRLQRGAEKWRKG